MPLKRLFQTSDIRQAAYRLYGAIVEQARRPPFYLHAGVPDSFDGRFDMIALHVFLVLRRLRDAGPAAALAQELVDAMMADMDRNLREMGVGDLAVPRKTQAMAAGLRGRMAAYDKGLDAGDDGELIAALRRNLFGTVGGGRPEDAAIMVGYMRVQTGLLADQPMANLLAGQARFGEPPGAPGAALGH